MRTTIQLAGLIALIATVGCSSSPVADSSLPKRLPSDELASAFHHPEWLPLDLERGESWFEGSRDAESLAFEADAREIRRSQDALRKLARLKSAPRVFHEKSHGCMTGTIEIENDLSDAGFFSGSKKRSLPVLARFSNGLPVTLPDAMPDFRGLSVKIFDEEGTVDLTSFTSATGIGRTQRDTVQFLGAFFDSPKVLARFLSKNTDLLARLVKVVSNYVPTLVGETYYSGHAYLLKPGTPMHYKFVPLAAPTGARVRSVELGTTRASARLLAGYWWNRGLSTLKKPFRALSPNYLAQDLARRAPSGEPIEFDLVAQTWAGDGVPPVEDNMVIWDASNSRDTKIARVRLNPADVLSPRLQELCKSARFTPGHHAAANRPLSTMGRGRVFVYYASSSGRGAPDGELKWSDVSAAARTTDGARE